MKMNCPICKEEVYSEVGKGCLMCGMPLTKNKKEFCSLSCKAKYNKINNLKINTRRIKRHEKN